MPHKDREQGRAHDRAYRRRIRRERQEVGLCIDCGTKSRYGALRCRGCMDKHNEQMEITYQNRLEAGVCIRCARPLDNPAMTTCVVCREPQHFNPMLGG